MVSFIKAASVSKHLLPSVSRLQSTPLNRAIVSNPITNSRWIQVPARQSRQPIPNTIRQYSESNRLAQLNKSASNQTTSHYSKSLPSTTLTSSSNKIDKVVDTVTNRSTLLPIVAGGALVGTLALQATIGSEDNYYEYRFTTDKDPDDLAGFYGSEEFMELFCVVPFMGTLMMRGGEFDEQGGFHTTGIPGKLSVNMVFSDEQDPDTGKTLWFNKRERFKDTFCDHTMWDTVMNFGFRTLPNGKIECYHAGEYFKGSAPPVSLAVKLMFQIHARWVAWATEHHVNHHAFTAETEEEEAIEECSRQHMPLHLLRDHVLTDLKAMLLGSNKRPEEVNPTPDKTMDNGLKGADRGAITVTTEKKPSFLVNRKESGDPTPISDQLPKEKIQADIEADKRAHTKEQQKEKVANFCQRDIDIGDRDFSTQAWDLLRSTNDSEGYQRVTNAAKQRRLTRRADNPIPNEKSPKI